MKAGLGRAVGVLCALVLLTPVVAALHSAPAGATEFYGADAHNDTVDADTDVARSQPKGDIFAYGGTYNYSTVSFVTQLGGAADPAGDANWDLASGASVSTGMIWEIDVNGDEVEDYNVVLSRFEGDVRATVSTEPDLANVCTGMWSRAATDTLTVAFPASCIGTPSSFQFYVGMLYSTTFTSRDLTPETGWAGPVHRDVSPAPFGNLESVRVVPGGVRASGWAIDPDTTGAVTVHLVLDGGATLVSSASLSRPDVGSAYPSSGPNHGFDETLGVGAGPHTICAFAINNASGPNTKLGCRTLNIGLPFGSFDKVVGNNLTGPRAQGWVIDSDTTGPISVHLYLDGRFLVAAAANSSRPDVGVSYPAWGNNHGFDIALPRLPHGTHQLCAYAINFGAGTNPRLGCRNVTANNNPTGSLDSITVEPSVLRVVGWAIDPSVLTPIQVHLYLDGRFAAVVTANTGRPDVGSSFPAFGPNHGYETTLGRPANGAHSVCAYGINVGGGTTNPKLGCRAFMVS